MNRTATKRRPTKETDITVTVNIDGSGISKIDTGIGFLDHMLELFSFWGFFDLEVQAAGDLKVDIHHTNEDIGIVLGSVFKEALGEKQGIRRIGYASVPMEDVVVNVAVDISGRGSFSLQTMGPADRLKVQDGYAVSYAQHFFDSFAKQLGMNLNISINPVSDDLHATLEPAFKAFGIALDLATQIDPRRTGVPSTKGVID